MLEPEILKPYLLDDDPWVRSAVAKYFDEGWFQDEELVALILTNVSDFATGIMSRPWRAVAICPWGFANILLRI